jgi:rhodanese-related sulfurtransferase
MSSTSTVTAIPAAPPAVAAAHFEALLAVETDCWDVHEAMASGAADFVLLHVNGDQAGFDAGHVPGAVFMHHSTLSAETLADYPADTLFVVYCAGPHCNAADRAGAALARLGRPVKKMIGGRIGWLDEGFDLATS